MKKYSMRVLACFMACVIAFNVIAIPKAKASAAVVGTSALATSALASYMTATGVPLTVISGGAAAASAGTASLITGYAATTGATYEVVTTAIATGATIGMGGAIILGAAAVAVLAGITAWVISEHALSLGADPVDVFDCSGVEADIGFFTPSSFKIPVESSVLGTGIPIGQTVTFATGYKIMFDGSRAHATYADGTVKDWSMTESDPTSLYYVGKGSTGSGIMIGYYLPDGIFHWSGASKPSYEAVFGTVESIGLAASLSPDYAPKPELAPNTQVRIETGVSPKLAPEAVPDAIFESIAANDFAPTYVEEPVADTAPDTGGDTGEDTGTDPDASEDTGLLRRIAIACEVLADKILGGIESLFAPDAELMQEISDTFNSKFGFVSTLHQLGSDLLAINATSAPPVVYIHLEDAEGSIYYGETVKALDMTWYARYKEDVDRIMSGFLWIGFLWLLFKRAAAIIRGAEMIYEHNPSADSLDAVQMYYADHNFDTKGRPIR